MNDTSTSNWPVWVAVLALSGLTACGQSAEQLALARSASCTELAREIGKQEQRHRSAQIDGFFNSVISITTDDKEVEQHAGLDSAVNLVDELDAGKSLDQLEKIYRDRGCS